MCSSIQFPFAGRALVWLALVLTITSCDHDTEPDGPQLVDRFGPFNVVENLSANRLEVDFAEGESVSFSAAFNKNVDWVLTIIGNTSGAVKVIEGFDRTLSSTNATWSGGTTIIPFFREESVTAILTVPEEPDYADTLELEILAPKIYEGILFTDFEQDAGSNIFLGNFEFEFSNNVGRQTSPVPPQGEYFWLMEGTDDVVPNFFVGLIQISPLVNGLTYAEVPTTNPENLYFNFFLYNDGRPYGIAVIQFAYDSNDSGSYEDGVDQTFQLTGDFPLNFNGWRKFSHTMAAVGMNSEQVQKIVTIRVLLISDMNSQPNPPLEVQFGIDYLTFTQGAPLQL